MIKNYKYILLGGGTTAGYAAEELVSQGVDTSRILIIGDENCLPINRPPLSKDFLSGKAVYDELLINDQNYYDEHGIDVLTNNGVTKVDFSNKILSLKNGEQVKYRKLLIATGSKVKKLNVPGSDKENVFYPRNVNDAKKILKKADSSKKAVILGGGFIASEVAASLRQRGLENAVLVHPKKYPLDEFKNEEIGIFFNHLFYTNGVDTVPNARVVEFIGDDTVQQVKLDSGDTIPADLVVAGIGVEPDLDLFEHSVLEMDDGIIVNEYCETNIPDVYAAGDVARFPDPLYNKTRRLDHWQNALEQGKHAAKVMTGYHEPYLALPYYFSDLFDFSFEFFGDANGPSDYVIKGNVNKGDFSVFWVRRNKIIAAFISSSRREVERKKAREWIINKSDINIEVLRDTNAPFEVALI